MQASNIATVSLNNESRGFVVKFGGNWRTGQETPFFEETERELTVDVIGGVLLLEQENLEEWDSSLLLFVMKIQRHAEKLRVDCDLSGLPVGVRNLIQLASAVPAQKASGDSEKSDFLSRVGLGTLQLRKSLEVYSEFLGQFIIDFGRFLRGRSQFRGKDFWNILQSAGPRALPIVSLLSFLTGLIIAFIGVIQLQEFAADIYVADLVGLAMTRELGAVMAGVIMAGRTGAAFAAQIGSMQVNEEVDALKSFGISPMQFLVLPRVIALVLMMPLLCVFADFVGILGGLAVAFLISDISVTQYVVQLSLAVDLSDFLGGVFKSGVFGIIIAFAGCYRGLECGRDANSVGLAATSAVVTSITWIVLADALFAVLFNMIGI